MLATWKGSSIGVASLIIAGTLGLVWQMAAAQDQGWKVCVQLDAADHVR